MVIDNVSISQRRWRKQ